MATKKATAAKATKATAKASKATKATVKKTAAKKTNTATTAKGKTTEAKTAKATAKKAPLMAGFARMDITAPLGERIIGYYGIRLADGILDPLYVNAVAFGKGDDAAVMIVCDLLSILGDLAHRLPKIVADAVGIKEKSVFICHTHTHTGPIVDTYREPSDPMYDEWFTRRMCDVARLALDDRKPVTQIRGAEDDCPGMACVRRFFMKDGTVAKPMAYEDENIVDYAEKPDTTMRVVRILRGTEKEIVLVNFQSHPDNLGGTKYSADYPGELRRVVEKEKNVNCLFFDGAEGDMIPQDRSKPKRLSGYEGMLQYGRELACHALKLYDRAEPIKGDALVFDRVTLKGTTKRDPSRVEKAKYYVKRFEDGEKLILAEEMGVSAPEIDGICAESYHLIKLEEMKADKMNMFVTVVAFGGVAFIGLPGEPFCEVGVNIREASPYAMTCVCCHTNGTEGYFPTAIAYDQGGYEPYNTKFVKGTAEQLTKGAIKLLHKVAGSQEEK